MDKLLIRMQDTVSKYTKVLSQVLKVDVEIVDDHLYRVAGTGMFQEKVNTNMSNEGYVYRTVIETGKSAIIKEPGTDKLCFNCPKRNKCDEYFEMSTPIKLDNKVIGVIGFVCFTEEQRDHILENYQVFLEFLEQIADLISSKSLEVMEQEKTLAFLDLLNNIIDKIDQGVLICDKNNILVKANGIAVKVLGLKEGDYCGKPVRLEPTGSTILQQKQYKLILGNVHYTTLGNEYKFTLKSGDYNRIFIFEDEDRLMGKVLAFTHTRENVGMDKILGESSEILDIKKKVKKISKYFSTVLITGESGTGKELFARAIHEESPRRDNHFVPINCAAIPDTLLESELFGYSKGAFTGADPHGKIGKIELANKGTLFLDEIGDMPLYLQAKLLRVLEQRKITKLGSNKPVSVDIRVIAATNKDLEELIKHKQFRKDLYYRLNVIPLQLPPLRERVGDIRLLTIFFINKFSKLFNKEIIMVEEEVWEYFNQYKWPGNIRELQNTIEYMVNMAEHQGVLCYTMLPAAILDNQDYYNNTNYFNLELIEKRTIKRALDLHGDSWEEKKKVADKLGIGIATLYRKLKKYNIK